MYISVSLVWQTFNKHNCPTVFWCRRCLHSILLRLHVHYKCLVLHVFSEEFLCNRQPMTAITRTNTYKCISHSQHKTSCVGSTAVKIGPVQFQAEGVKSDQNGFRYCVCFVLVSLLLVNVCFRCIQFSFVSTKPRGWLERTFPKWPVLCRKNHKSIIDVRNCRLITEDRLRKSSGL